MGKDWLTVKEFAELAGVSVQSIYKKLGKANNPIQRYLKVVDGVKYISYTAYEVLYSGSPAPRVAEQEQPPQMEEQPQVKSSTDRILDILEQQLEEQRRQLQEKDKQIAAQAEQINSLLARLEESSTIINQQQQLTAMNIKGLLAAEPTPAPATEEEPPQQPEVAEEMPPPPPPQKKGFWSRLFGKE